MDIHAVQFFMCHPVDGLALYSGHCSACTHWKWPPTPHGKNETEREILRGMSQSPEACTSLENPNK
jgi:hypothetical protein